MTIVFYPYIEDAKQGSLMDRIEILTEAAERYKAAIFDAAASVREGEAPPDFQI